MRRIVISLSFVVFMIAVALSANVAAEVVVPPAINMPAGGKIVTEINLSDNDVLGIVKQSIPALADVLKELAPTIAQRAGAQNNPGWAKLISLEEFSQAISGVRDVRVLIARYPKMMTPERFLSEFSAGVAKTGQFNKIVSDFGFFPGSMAMFAAPENAGIIAFAYNPEEHTAYAVRVVGGLDVPKLIHWSGQIAKMFVAVRSEVQVEPPAQPIGNTPVPDAAAPQPHLEVK